MTRVRVDIADVTARAAAFRSQLQEAKASVGGPDFKWSPHNPLDDLVHLDRLLTGERRFLADLIGSDPVLDVRCADGDLSFFLESTGCRVTAADNPLTNHNAMCGVRALKAALHSGIEVAEIDLDSSFEPPRPRYGVAFCFGVLRYFRNPFLALDQLARRARYCVLSAQVKQGAWPIACLGDDSNGGGFWILSEAALRRLLRRTYWEICDFLDTGNDAVFFLLRSHFGLAHLELLHGWHAAETSGWRWTEKRFSAVAGRPPHREPARLVLKVFVPDVLLERAGGALTLDAAIGGHTLAPATFHKPGNHTYSRGLPEAARHDNFRLDFSLDHALSPAEADGRELGLIVESIEIE